MPNRYDGYSNDPRDPRDPRNSAPPPDDRDRRGRDDGRNDQRAAYNQRQAPPNDHAQSDQRYGGGDRRDPRAEQRPQQPQNGGGRIKNGLIPEDRYKVKCVSCSFSRSSQKATKQVEIGLEITEGEFIGRRLQYLGYFVGGTTDDEAVEAMQALGHNSDDITETAGMFRGVEGVAVVRHETDTRSRDGVRVRVRWVNRGDMQIGKPMSGGELSNFAQQMRGKMANRSRQAQGSGGGQQRQQSAAPPPPRDRGGYAPPPRDDRRDDRGPAQSQQYDSRDPWES